MTRLRRALGRLATALLLCQASVLAATPLSLCVEVMALTDAQACTCSHDDGQACPMHNPQPKSPCSCRTANDSTAAAVLSLFGPSAVMTRATDVSLLALISRVTLNPDAVPFDTLVIPDSPPPRA